MKVVLKGIIKTLLLWGFFHGALLWQLYEYDRHGGGGFLLVLLPIVTGVIAYFVFAVYENKDFWKNIAGYLIVGIIMGAILFIPGYLTWILGFVVNGHEVYYELTLNALLASVLHGFACMVAFIIQLIRHRRFAKSK